MNKKEEIQSIVKSAVQDFCIIMDYNIKRDEDGKLFIGTTGKPFMVFYTEKLEGHYYVFFESIIYTKVKDSKRNKIEAFIKSEDMSIYLEQNFLFLQFDEDNNLKLTRVLSQEDKIEKVLKSQSLLIIDQIDRESRQLVDIFDDAEENT